MAASVIVQQEGNNIFTYSVRGIFSVADETDTVILDLSTKTGPNGPGAAPSKIRIDEVWWTINGFSYVLLEFDRTTDVVVDYFTGQGYMDYYTSGGKIDTGTGNTGDLLLTTVGGSAGASYSFIIRGRYKQ